MRFEILKMDNGYVLKYSSPSEQGIMGFGGKEKRMVFNNINEALDHLKTLFKVTV
jgi:hypothetical protein